MTRPRRLAPLAAVLAATALAAVPAPAASAAPAPTVRLTYQAYRVPLDAGYLLVVVCGASADPGTPALLPVATEVRCSVAGATASAVAPGGEVVTALSTPVADPATICLSGEAAFLDPLAGRALTASRATCEVLAP